MGASARDEHDPAPEQPAPGQSPSAQPAVVGVLAAPGLAADFASQLELDLRVFLHARFPEADWNVVSHVEALAGPPGTDVDLVQIARRRMLDEGWTLAVVLTDLPIHVGSRPVTAHISVTLGVGVISVPALGAVATERRVRETVFRVIEGLIAESERGRKRVTAEVWRRGGLRARLQNFAYPLGRAEVRHEDTVQFVTDTGRGNLRLVIGMVRANRPWRLITGLSRVLVAALGAAAFTVTSPGMWLIVDGLGWQRLLALAIGAVAGMCILLIAVHGLLEPLPPEPRSRHRVLTFNLATTVTIALGVTAHYAALFVITVVAAFSVIAPSVFAGFVHHPVGPGDYLRLAWLVTTVGTVGGALGAAVESDRAVREAAYGYRPQDRERA